MNKYVRATVALVAVQAVLLGGYLLAGERRGSAAGAQAPEIIALPLPNLVVRYADGSSGNVADLRGKPILLHFWATWCPPCREELPGLLALAEGEKLRVLLVALDKDWAPVRRFLDGDVPAAVALADGNEVERLFGVQELPETFVVDHTGSMTLRFRGARDWTQAATLDLLPQEIR